MKIKSFTFLIILLTIKITNAQWSEQVSPVTSVLNSVSAVDNNNVWICGTSGVVLKTTNGGINWVSANFPNSGLPLYNIWAIDANTVVTAGSNANTAVWRTTNAGGSWTQVFTQAGGFIDGITQRVTPNKLLMVGNPVGGRWSIWKSDDNGATWDSTQFYLPQAGTETGFNNSLCLLPQLGAWFGTNNTKIYKRDFNSYFTEVTPSLVNSNSVWFNDGQNGMTGGTSLLKTSNGGTLWAPLAAPGSGTIQGITGASTNWWYARGGSIYFSTNNGLIWSTDFTAPAGNYNHITTSRTGGHLWAIRSNGGISTSTGPNAIQPISNEIPAKFSLSQNYPNPFNPSSKIKFEVPKSSFIVLTVYDVMGKELTTLVNEQLQPGVYSVDWNGSNFASGVYFYKIVVRPAESSIGDNTSNGGFIEVKKMALLK